MCKYIFQKFALLICHKKRKLLISLLTPKIQKTKFLSDMYYFKVIKFLTPFKMSPRDVCLPFHNCLKTAFHLTFCVYTKKKICQIIILGFDTSFVKEAVVSLQSAQKWMTSVSHWVPNEISHRLYSAAKLCLMNAVYQEMMQRLSRKR